ncbi:MAG: sensor histidine kinase [bacterium]
MQPPRHRLVEKLRLHHFELKHVLVLFIVVVAAQILVSFIQKNSLQGFLLRTQDWYQRDSAEQIANLAATSLELLLETSTHTHQHSTEDRQKIVQALNIIFSQQLLIENIEEACVLVGQGEHVLAIDNGAVLYDYFFENRAELPPADLPHAAAMQAYRSLRSQLLSTEQIHSILEGKQTFHVFAPFVPKGEYAGAVYLKNKPDFGFVTRTIIASFNNSSLAFVGAILFGLVAMLYVSSHAVRERDETQKILFQERENQLKERIHFQKEAQFAKRIYHTHHKAEKVMGFIKEDVRSMSAENIEEMKYRVTKYANFMSRVIYDMKWYDPPIYAIRNPVFRTDLNEVLRFIVENICLRVAAQSDRLKFHLDLDGNLPNVPVNEFVVWEIFEPLLRNSMEHSGEGGVTVSVQTRFDPVRKQSRLIIADNGKGIEPALLEANPDGVKRLFLEHISTKDDGQNGGYGCYLAYEISKQRCGWELDVENLPEGGCQFTLIIPHEN